MKTKFITRLSYENIFKEKESVDSLLKRINFSEGIISIAYINSIDYKFSSDDGFELNFILNEWLTNSSKEFKNKIINAYTKYINENNRLGESQNSLANVKIINKLTTVRALQILLTQKIDKSKEIDSTISFENLFQFYLKISNEVTERQNKVFEKWFNIDNIRLHLFLGITHIDVPLKIVYQKLFSEVLKLLLFEKWIKKNKNYTALLDEYLTSIGEKSLYEYFNKLFILSKYSIDKFIIDTETNKNFKPLLTFLSKRTEINDKWDELISIKSNPIYKPDEEKYLILDSGFLIDKFFSGIYHDLVKISKIDYPKFHQDYSKSFAEEYLLENSLKCTFKNSYIQFSEKKIKESSEKTGSLSLPDYYVRNGNKILFFEFKNSILSNVRKVKLDFEEIENEIKEKFYHTNKKKKAVKQLIGFISNSLDGKYSFFDDVKKPENLRFYPILVVTDKTLSSIGFNKLLNEYFYIEKNKLNISNSIRKLTIIHIDDFLFFNKNLKRLDNIIDEYYKYLKKQNEIDGMISFSQYLELEKFKNYSVKLGNVDDILKDSLLPKE